MAYKQPYKKVHKQNNDGASAIGTIAGISTLIGKIATAAKAVLPAAKSVGTALKTGSGVAKGVETAGTTASTITKGAKATGKASKFLGKVSDKGKKALDKGKKIVDKGRDVYDKGAKKISDATGIDSDKVKEAGQRALSETKSKVSESRANRASEIEEIESKDTTPAGSRNVKSVGSYSNPGGPNMFDYRQGPSMGKNRNIDNDGASQDNKKLPEDYSNQNFSSLDNLNLFKSSTANNLLNSYSAPMTIKGISFDAADALRLGIMGVKLGKEGVESYQLKERGGKKFKGEKKLQKANKKAANKPKTSLEKTRGKIVRSNASKKSTMAQNVIGLNKRKYDNIV